MPLPPGYTPPAPEDHALLSDMLERYAAKQGGERVSLGDIVHLMEARSIGVPLLIFALPVALPIPMPGISLVFGIPLVIISAQLIIGCQRIWLPEWLAKRSMAHERFTGIITKILPTLRTLEQVVKPRLSWLVQDWMKAPIGVLCVLLALIVALPIPFGNVVPSLAISLFALALIQRDGLVMALGALTAIVGVGIIVGILG